VLNDPPCPPRDVNPHVPEALQQVILRALRKEPAARHETMAQFMEAVLDATDEKHADDAEVTVLPQRLAAPTKTPTRTPTDAVAATAAAAPSARRSARAMIAALVLFAAVAAGAGFGWDRWQKRHAGKDVPHANDGLLLA